MDSERRLFPVEDIFAEAISRVEAGESIEGVVASYPAEHHAELHDLLQIVALATQIQLAPVPRPSPARRAAHKEAFLQAAGELRIERAVTVPVAPEPKPVAQTPWGERLAALWSNIQAAFTVRTMRLAPVIVVLTLVLLSSFSLVTLAQEAIPGDLTYPVKQWIRYQQLNLSPPALRPQMLKDYEQEFQEDVQKAAVKAQKAAGDSPDKNRSVIRTNSILTFHNDAGAFMVIGGLQVLQKYQPDANNDHDFRDMTIIGKPAPGEQVILEYQILPQSGNMAAPMVQGIRLARFAASASFTNASANQHADTDEYTDSYLYPSANCAVRCDRAAWLGANQDQPG